MGLILIEYKSTDIVPVMGIMAEEIWKKDEIKNSFIKNNGYKLLIIWEKDLIEKGSEVIIEESTQWIKNNLNLNLI